VDGRKTTVQSKAGDALEVCRVVNGMWQASGASWARAQPAAAVDAMLRYADGGLTTFDMADICKEFQIIVRPRVSRSGCTDQALSCPPVHARTHSFSHSCASCCPERQQPASFPPREDPIQAAQSPKLNSRPLGQQRLPYPFASVSVARAHGSHERKSHVVHRSARRPSGGRGAASPPTPPEAREVHGRSRRGGDGHRGAA